MNILKRSRTRIISGIVIVLAVVFNTGYFVYKSVGNQQSEKISIVRNPINPKDIEIKTPFLHKTESIIMSPAESGELVKAFRIKADGFEKSNELIWAKIFKNPLPGKILIGTSTKKKMYMMKKQMKVKKTLIMRATAYYPGPEDCGPYANGYTYLDYKAGYGVVAVDPRVIKLGTKVYVEGYGYALAVDIGGAIKGKKIDLCFNTLKESSRFGVKNVVVHILN